MVFKGKFSLRENPRRIHTAETIGGAPPSKALFTHTLPAASGCTNFDAQFITP